MIHVRSLHVYPVKSCRGIDLDEAEIIATGFRHDRQWMLVDEEGGFLSQRSHPELARVSAGLDSDTLVLQAPGQPELRVPFDPPTAAERSVRLWKDRCHALDEGPAAAEWFSSFLGTPCSLVRQSAGAVRRVDPRFGSKNDRVAFADAFPFLLISSDSVDELNTRLSCPVATDRFRANIVVTGCQPYAEDSWREIEISGIGFTVAKSCARCVIVTNDQTDGSRTSEPLRTLARYRRFGTDVIFGQNLLHRRRGWLRVGDEVSILVSRAHP
jgi:uncharacterized protein YcbX